MSYSAGSATSPQDFLSQLSTFAVAAGWTQDEFDTTNKRFSLHKGSCYVQFVWDTSGNIAVHQSLGFTLGTAANAQLNSAGNTAQTTGTITQGRYTNLMGAGPYTSHFFFGYSSPTDCIYAAIEVSPGVYRHIGFGNLDKYGTWTGGEFAGCTFWDQNASRISDYSSTFHNILFDAGNGQFNSATVHVEGLPGMGGSSKWALVNGSSSTGSALNDTAGNAREWVHGGMRTGPYSEAYGKYETSLLQGFVPLIPLPAFYRNRTTTPNRVYFIGYFPNVRAVNLAALEPQAEITLGTDVWKVFPFCRKQAFVNDGTQQSGNGGVAFLKV